MSSSFDPSLSTSGMRPPLASADAPSMADSLPSINFGFEDLRNRMAQFTARFDAFIERGRKQVLEERNQFKIGLAELQEDKRMKQRDIEILDLKSQTHQQTLQKEAAEAAEMHAAISSVTLERDSRLAKRDRLKQQIDETQKAINQKLEAQKMHARYLDAQARLNVPELDFWQDYLCLRIEGAGREDRLKFVYTHLLEKDWETEAWFELGTGSRDYAVFHTRPKLDREALERELDIVNEDRDFGAFLKRMRKLFVDTMK
ncbi:kinetochore-associated Ndc80 complex subunit spc25 [Aspergillus tubingensis]|uniref:Kinetochore protein SPC25 n=1 Tax=Aspergillus tubingensis TaxID=5068 RepID=A0A8H3T016_ASPTU|nr:kinetochore protein Spc25 [Aspergillus tubingensis]GFN19292.1 kinetochore protein Spc25 [Aspergillus tubingensis]GLA63511.1 kinetochore-associated Ndc80 complex subunit spc25 [Aspergillus tubingensis]GLA76194.1 kinetochore-associated Ndc80 complex subunit spc25 [Aspergillus tubingensis]GLA80209.1 kinetochore-associated Ndc80 complex subunit spc25 [Aspergillus tubingensis]